MRWATVYRCINGLRLQENKFGRSHGAGFSFGIEFCKGGGWLSRYLSCFDNIVQAPASQDVSAVRSTRNLGNHPAPQPCPSLGLYDPVHDSAQGRGININMSYYPYKMQHPLSRAFFSNILDCLRNNLSRRVQDGTEGTKAS